MRAIRYLAGCLVLFITACGDDDASDTTTVRDAGDAGLDAGRTGDDLIDAGTGAVGSHDAGGHLPRDAGMDAMTSAAPDSGATGDAGGMLACRRDALIIRGDTDGDADGGVEGSFVGGIWGANLAVDGAGSYFTAFGFGGSASEHAVLRLPLREDEPEVVWHAPNTGVFGRGMAVDGDIFVTASSGVLAIHPKTGTHDVLAKLPTQCAPYGGVAADKDNVYAGTLACASDRPGVVAKVPRAGGTATAIWSSATVSVTQVAAQDGFIYFSTDADDLRRIDDSGAGEITLIAKTADARSSLPKFALTKTHAYFLTGTEVWTVPLDGSAPSLLASARLSTSIAADDSGVYVGLQADPDAGDTSAASIIRIASDGSIDTLASGVYSEELALDATSVYWSAQSFAGRIDKCVL